MGIRLLIIAFSASKLCQTEEALVKKKKKKKTAHVTQKNVKENIMYRPSVIETSTFPDS